MTASRPFLLARLVTDQLRTAPIDTTRPGWHDEVRQSSEAAFDADLATVDHDGPGRTRPVARLLLAGLAWAFGAGFPE